MIQANCSQKTSDSLKKRIFCMFLTVFLWFSAVLSPRANGSCGRSSISRSLKEWPWVIRSGCSWQKNHRSDSLIFMSEPLFRTQKQAIRLKNRWANSYPWLKMAVHIWYGCNIKQYFVLKKIWINVWKPGLLHIESMQRCMYSMTQKPDIYCCILSIYNKLDFYDDI